MDHRKLRDCVLLIGYNPEGHCVYSSQMRLADCWDGEHVWDADNGVQNLRLERLHGYLFELSGELVQEFESIFDIATGVYKSGWQKHSDGTHHVDAP